MRELRKHAAAMTVIWDDRTPVAAATRAPRRASQTLKSREDFLAAMLGAIGGADGDAEPKRSPSTPGRRSSMGAMVHHSEDGAGGLRPTTPGSARRRSTAAAEWVSPMEAEREKLRANERRRSMPMAADGRKLFPCSRRRSAHRRSRLPGRAGPVPADRALLSNKGARSARASAAVQSRSAHAMGALRRGSDAKGAVAPQLSAEQRAMKEQVRSRAGLLLPTSPPAY